ncbi:MAG: hypothetical protein ACHQ1G_02160 [Planctomycetota bacterium]
MRVAGIALTLSVVALGIAVVTLTRETPEPRRAPPRMDRVDALESQVAELRREVEVLKAPRQERTGQDTAVLPQRAEVAEGAGPASIAEDAAELTAIVDDAVERKTERVLDELRVKADKKPAMDVFASTLELSEVQRHETERAVVEGQREVYAIIGTPTYDGTNLMDQLVEIAAKGIAEPGKDHGWGPWLARVLTEKVPGTDETYGARIESVKNGMRATFKREWSETQYREFEGWGVDPTEIEQVPGSPNEALLKRITERARALGANLPKD